MTPEQVALTQQSYAAVADRLDELGRRFYENLFSTNPELRPMFTTDLAIQQGKFTDQLTEIISSISRLDTFVDEARALGKRHVDYGVRARHYAPVGAALIAAFADVLGDDFTPDVRDAWQLAYNLVAETMQQGKEH
jgi:hemoglobin-like flavoprotein